MIESASSSMEATIADVRREHWVDVLVDCPGVQGLFTYRVSAELGVQPGDIVSIPFGAQQVGGIAIQTHSQCPPERECNQIREIEAVSARGFFAPTYWQWLNQIAHYYHTPLMQVVRVALPPGLLARSQRRIRLSAAGRAIQPANGGSSVGTIAQQIFCLLHSSKAGDYSWMHIQRTIKQARKGLPELVKLGWVEQYIEPPEPVKPKLRQAVTLLMDTGNDLTPRQQEILTVLKKQGGELWVTELLQLCRITSNSLKSLTQKGYLVVQPREVLRQETGIALGRDRPKELTPDQAIAVESITKLSGSTQVLLHGVTGSGKTEVYLQAIAPVLAQGQSALVLVPEIGLTPQLTDRFRARFGDRVCVYHSGLSDGERYDTWRQMLTGRSQVVIGTRSAIFLPLPNLGLMILDEEHDSSFKQDQPAPCYHARTVAQWRSHLESCPLILGSATPSLESWVNADMQYLSLPKRVHDRPLPPVQVVDMRQELLHGNRSIFSRSLQEAIANLLDKQQQGILFIHRRGHSTFVSCRSCGDVMMCPNCDVSLSFHHTQSEAKPLLRCHYCNYIQSVPKTCPTCESIYFKHFGSGTQRVTQELERLFPQLRIIRYDSDTTRTKGSHRALLTQFADRQADILVGTQMLTKGIDLPQVTLVGIVAADGLLHLADYRASERAFQTLTQVAGRSGRGADPGRVILQTYSPDHAVIQAVKHHQFDAFVTEELSQRQALNYPPYGRLVLLRFSGPDADAVQTSAERVGELFDAFESAGIQRLGPAPATILRVAQRFRWQLLLKIPLEFEIALPELEDLRSRCRSGVSLAIDVDPVNLM